LPSQLEAESQVEKQVQPSKGRSGTMFNYFSNFLPFQSLSSKKSYFQNLCTLLTKKNGGKFKNSKSLKKVRSLVRTSKNSLSGMMSASYKGNARV
jgi:hypothetical protein